MVFSSLLQNSLDLMLSNCCHVSKNLFHLNSSLDEEKLLLFRGVCEIQVVTDLEQWRGQSLCIRVILTDKKKGYLILL